MVMEEKKKYVKLKQMASQTITELTEQIKVLENESEIQRTIAINKDRCLGFVVIIKYYNSIITDPDSLKVTMSSCVQPVMFGHHFY